MTERESEVGHGAARVREAGGEERPCEHRRLERQRSDGPRCEHQRSEGRGHPTVRRAAASGDPVPARAVDWRRVLAGASPREVLARLINGDPLGLAAVVEQRLRARAYLLDADRVVLRTAARCARLALRYRGDPPLARWLAERADEAVGDLLRADAESELRGEPPGSERLAVFEVLARPLGLDPVRMHSACLAHNQLPEPQRRAFREVVLEGRELDALAAEGERSATEIARAARAALRCVLTFVEDPAGPAGEPPDAREGTP